MRATITVIAILASISTATTATPRDGDPAPTAWNRAQKAAAVEIVDRLDITSFPNSIGPRRRPGARTLADYGLTKKSSFDDGWVYTAMPDKSWMVGVFILKPGRQRRRICITDTSTSGGTYRSINAVDVRRRPDGSWVVAQVVGPVTGCSA